MHSTESDGTLTPEQVVYAAKEAGLSAIALTDHDTCSGVAKAQAAAGETGIELIPGIELSASYALSGQEEKEIHVVGLFIDTQNQALLEKTAEFRAFRDRRNEKMVELLQKEGFPITMEALRAENPDCVITRANIARFLAGHGYVKSIALAFERYIGDGCRCYVGRFKVAPMEAVSLIKGAGGVAILAHPLLYRFPPPHLQRLADDMKAAGLDGIEAIYSSHSPKDEAYLRAFARENGLLISGGSDFHGACKPDIRLGRGRGGLHVPYSVLEDIKARACHSAGSAGINTRSL